MKKVLIVPILLLAMAAFTPAAHAGHGGAQTPDAEPEDIHCRTFFAGHGDCSIASASPGKAQMGTQVAGVPTADGWHVAFTGRIIDNDTNTILSGRTVEWTVPYVNSFGPQPPTAGLGLGSGGVDTTSASCATDVAVGTGGQIACTFDPFTMTIPYL